MNVKSILLSIAMLAVLTSTNASEASSNSFSGTTLAAGEYTKCIALISGQGETHIVGGNTKARCFAKAKRCADGRQYEATFYSNPVLITAPYKRCRTLG